MKENVYFFVIPVFVLAANSIHDVLKREIYLALTLVGIGAGLIFQLFLVRTSLLWILASLLPGILFFLTAILSREQIGFGDALAVSLAGIWSSAFDIWAIVFAAAFLTAIFAGILWIRKRRNAQIPFVPFLLAGFLFYLVWK